MCKKDSRVKLVTVKCPTCNYKFTINYYAANINVHGRRYVVCKNPNTVLKDGTIKKPACRECIMLD